MSKVPRGRRQLVVRGTGDLPAWSPDGTWIAYGGGAVNGTFIVHPNGTSLRRLADADLSTVATWSPDSQRLAVAFAQGPGKPSDIWVVSVRGRAVRITQGWRYGYSSYAPQWQPRNLPPQRLGGTVVSPALPTDSVVTGNVLQSTRPVMAISGDGGLLAIQYGPGPPAGGKVETWAPQTGSIVRFNTSGYQGPALAGDQVATASFEHALGTNAYGILLATVEHPNPSWGGGLCPATAAVQFCIRDPLGDLVGQGSLLVFDSWKGPEPYCNEPCPLPKHDGRLFRVDNGTAVQIDASSAELTPLAVDNGRILVDEGSGTLAVLDSSGATLQQITAPGFTEAAIQGADVAVHNGLSLDDYDAVTGALLRSWPIAADAILEDVQDGIAVYVTTTSVHLLRLADGRDRSITPAGQGPIHAQLEAAGLFYSYSVGDESRPGRVAFVPSTALP